MNVLVTYAGAFVGAPLGSHLMASGSMKREPLEEVG